GTKSLLPATYFNPLQHVGALIGSFDNFKTGFVIGSDSTLVVPANAKFLYLAINDFAGQFKDNTGTFQVNLNISNPQVLPTSMGLISSFQAGVPIQLPAGSILPKLSIDVM